jgi:hypothetical protein
MYTWYKNIVIGIICAILFLPTHTQAVTNINAGIVNGVWFSKLPFFTGDTIVIYTAFQNQSHTNLEGTIDFIHNESVIGTKPFTAKPGEFITRSIEWTASYGDHTFKVTLNGLVDEHGSAVLPTVKTDTEVQSRILFGDNDTDVDGIGNEIDTDDDNDGVTDIQEKKNGTDIVTENTSRTPTETIQNIFTKVDGIKDVLSVIVDNKVEDLHQNLQETVSTPVSSFTIATTTAAIATTTVDNVPVKQDMLFIKIEYWTLYILGLILRHDVVFYSLPAIVFMLFLRHMFTKYGRRE